MGGVSQNVWEVSIMGGGYSETFAIICESPWQALEIAAEKSVSVHREQIWQANVRRIDSRFFTPD